MRASKKLTGIALFAGAGGMHLGLEKAGINVLVSTDISSHAEATHKKNWPDKPFLCKDARQIRSSELIRLAGGIKPDIIFGGPPCQGFSTLGDKLSGDHRNTLFSAFARLVEDIGPRFVLIENVKALTTMYGGRFRDRILETFSRLGYNMSWNILNAADYGVPQIRNRVFFFGTKHSAAFTFPEPTHGPKADCKYETVGKAIMDIAENGTEIQNHLQLSHSERVVARYRLIPEGGRLPPPDELPEEIRRLNFGNTYKRLHRKQPALTMVPGNNAFPIHPTLNRSLTPREAARLQTFPDEFVFCGDRRSQCILVGNAVPPVLAESIGHSIVKHARAKSLSKNKELPHERGPAESSDFRDVKSTEAKDQENGFIDLFSGAGGFMIGFERAGFTPLLSVDINKYVALTHGRNYPTIPFLNGDISSPYVLDEICNRFSKKCVAVVVGGPPCQGFSIFGKRRFINTKGYQPHQDPRNRLVYGFIDVVRRLKPRWFVMENVPGFANLDNGMFLKTILEEFVDAGYSNVQAQVLNGADYGIPQLRRRLIVIGNTTGNIIPWPKKKFFAEPKEWQNAYRTVGEVILDLATAKSFRRHTCHVPMKHKPLLIERYKYIPEGEILDVGSLPSHLLTGYRTKSVQNYSHVFKRLHRHRPSITMVPGHNAFPIHPWLDRALTVREAARIQTFPDEVEFMGPRQEQCIQVGNAFPPLWAEVIANNIRKAEKNKWLPDLVPASVYYALVDKPVEAG
jgi:DNA (cytosine-5)-methyltransferase 1